MAVSTSLLSLPEDIFISMSEYLTAEDVTSLSQTCRYLRDALNNNTVWQKYLSENTKNLNLKKQRVKPPLKFEKGVLSPICDARKEHLKSVHILNNWMNGKFKEYRAGSNRRKNMYSCNISGKNMYQDRYVILKRIKGKTSSEPMAVEIWDFIKEPKLHAVIHFKSKNISKCQVFYCFGWNNVVITECGEVYIFSITLPDPNFPLLYSSVEGVNAGVDWSERPEHPGECTLNCKGWLFYTAQNYFILCKVGETKINVWDVNKAEKVGSFDPPLAHKETCQLELVGSCGNEWLFAQIQIERKYADKFVDQNTPCVVFDIKEQVFWPCFKFQARSKLLEIDLYKSHVIVLSPEHHFLGSRATAFVYDLKSSEVVNKKEFREVHTDFVHQNTECRKLQVTSRGTLVIARYNGFVVLDALSLTVLSDYLCDMDIFYVLHQFNLLDKSFILTFGLPIDNVSCEITVWDINGKSKWVAKVPFQHVSDDNLLISATCSKLIFFNYKAVRLCVYHFW